MSLSPTLRLLNGVEMPQLGLGTGMMDDAQSATVVSEAIGIGYRLLDTAEDYGNEAGVGEGVKRSGVPRREIFITTKFNRKWHSIDGVKTACENSLKRLATDYIDLYLIHWPNPDQDRYLDAFEGMVRLRDAGLIRAVGVSNFKPAHLAKLFAAGFVPLVNQIQLNPYSRRDDLVAIHREKGIITEGWSPLGGSGDKANLMKDPVIAEIAARHSRTQGQVILRWHVQSGFATPAKSASLQRQKENLDVFSFELAPADMAALHGLNNPDVEIVDADTFGH